MENIYEEFARRKLENDNWYEKFIEKLKNTKYGYVELNERNIDEIIFENVYFYATAEIGAMGEPCGMEIVTKGGKFYHTNKLVRKDVSALLAKRIPQFNSFYTIIGRARGVPMGFKYYDLGAGNSLLVRNVIAENFEKMGENLQKNSNFSPKWQDLAQILLKSQ